MYKESIFEGSVLGYGCGCSHNHIHTKFITGNDDNRTARVIHVLVHSTSFSDGHTYQRM